MRRRFRPWMAIAAAVAAVIAVVAWIGSRGVDIAPQNDPGSDSGRKSHASRSGDAKPDRHGLPEARPPAAAGPLAESPPDLGGEMDGTWEVVDMDQVRAAMPDNLYWKVAVPTDDPRVVEEREAERDRWNVEYGKVLSGTASEEEIRAYYDFRARLSSDYIEFTTHLLDHYGDELPERDVGLLELARRLHLKRLEEIPRRIEESLERKRQQDAARAAWLADEKAFRGDDAEKPAEDATGDPNE